ncbi:hypothetical protein [Paracoccus nototheniae]
MRHAPAALILMLMLAACSEGADSDYPALMPTDQILAEPALPAHVGAVRTDAGPVEAATLSRAEALRARARALSGPVVGDDLRRRAGG